MKLSALFIALILYWARRLFMQKLLLRRFWKIALRREISPLGGARRLTGDQTEALRASLINKPAKTLFC